MMVRVINILDFLLEKQEAKKKGKYPCTCLEDVDTNERRKRAEKSSDVIVSSSLSPMGNIHHRSDLRFANNVDSNRVPIEENISIQVRRSTHTFTPPTSSASQNSSANDLHLTSSARSIDLPQLKYAIEQFLVDDDDDPIYHIADEFPSGYAQGKNYEAIFSSDRSFFTLKIIIAMLRVQTRENLIRKINKTITPTFMQRMIRISMTKDHLDLHDYRMVE